MTASRMLGTAALAGFAPVVLAQLGGWVANEVNTTMCAWTGLRAAVMRDTVYMDGAYIYWRPGLADGSYGEIIQDTDDAGIAYTLNFSRPFSLSDNITALFGQQTKQSTGYLYHAGATLANDDEYFLYGGSYVSNTANDEPPGDTVLEYQQYGYGIDQAFSAGWLTPGLPDGITQYVAYGAAASVPSENLAFLFSGLHAPDFGPIIYPVNEDSTSASEPSNTLISVDFSTQDQEKWSNYTLPDNVQGRASAELVWVPVGKQGVLVAIGGVVDPAFASVSTVSENETASEDQSPTFMTNIDVYDIANQTWYTQSTTGGPGALTQGCAVMQPAKDYSSFNIYWYGGFDGLHQTDASYFNDAVWILSLPSFTWKQASANRTGYARAGHKCVMPYPDQMMVIGGQGALTGSVSDMSCLIDVIQIFNVSSAEWLDRYDPAVWSEYSVPSIIYEAIGGDGSGGATSTAPNTWNTSALADVFQVKYATSKISTYYPYPVATTTTSPIPTLTPTGKPKAGGVPKYLGPVLGVVLGLVFLSSIGVGVYVWRKWKKNKLGDGGSAPTGDRNNSIMNWMRTQERGATKSDVITTTEELQSNRTSPPPNGPRYYNSEYAFGVAPSHGQSRSMSQSPDPIQMSELSGEGFHELSAEPGAAELSDSSSAHGNMPGFARATRDLHSPSLGYMNYARDTDQGSLVSTTSFPLHTNSPPAPPSSASHATSSVAGAKPTLPRSARTTGSGLPDSAVLPNPQSSAIYNYASTPNSNGSSSDRPASELPTSVVPDRSNPRASGLSSGVSVLSERERAHLRNISDPATVSTMDGATIAPHSHTIGGRVASPPILEEGSMVAANAAAAAAMQDGKAQSIVSPPTNSTAEGDDYIGAIVSPLAARNEGPTLRTERKSAFHESQE
ncbi:hypothetical protein BD289DRAFT_481204 [Coniella lustricola]|uniref:Galactose oxidase/kelch, beta-propeller n=1 Tax=Coniella lustricola TaxID=2025994 RepID=A0A2T3AD58_9PEZI|nr:hypothetical protein BD289DRAFT_481204 [Coniella lustricola]